MPGFNQNHDELDQTSEDQVDVSSPFDDEDQDNQVIPQNDDPQLDPIEKAKADKALRAETMSIFGRFSTFGIYLFLAVGLGFLIGSWLDKTFDTSPVLTIFWVLCGLASSIMELVRAIKRASHIGDDDRSTSMKK